MSRPALTKAHRLDTVRCAKALSNRKKLHAVFPLEFRTDLPRLVHTRGRAAIRIALHAVAPRGRRAISGRGHPARLLGPWAALERRAVALVERVDASRLCDDMAGQLHDARLYDRRLYRDCATARDTDRAGARCLCGAALPERPALCRCQAR